MSVALADAQLSRKQLESWQAATGRYNFWDGSVRAGKSVVCDVVWIDYVLHHAPPGDLLMVGRTKDTIRRNVVNEILNFVGSKHARYKEGELTLFGRRIYVIGANDEQATTKIQGMTLAGAYVDEASTIPELFFDMLTSRFSVPGARLFATTNPDSPAHWLKVKYLDRASDPDADLRRFQFHIDDNPFLPPEFVKNLKHIHTGLWYKRFIEGQWCIAAGAVYEEWDPDLHVVSRADTPAISRRVCCGIDYGTTHPTRGYLLGVSAEDRPRLVVVDEWAPGKMTVSGHSADYRRWIAGREPSWVAVDPAAATFRMQLEAEGVTTMKAYNSVVSGIRVVSALLSGGLLIISDKCTELIREIPGYVWSEKATALGKDEPVKANDDCCDALRYAIASSRFEWGTLVPLTIPVDLEEAAA